MIRCDVEFVLIVCVLVRFYFNIHGISPNWSELHSSRRNALQSMQTMVKTIKHPNSNIKFNIHQNIIIKLLSSKHHHHAHHSNHQHAHY